MAQTYKTEGVVLKRWDYKEKDRMVRLLTRDYGKITTRAISAKKHGAKLAGHLEPFVHTDLHIARSKTIDIIAGSSTVGPHHRLRESVFHNALASYFLEVVDLFTDYGDPDPDLYTLVLEVLRYMDAHDHNALLVHAALLQVLGHLGYYVDLHTCHACHKPLEEGEHKLHYNLWGVECEDCTSHDETRRLSTETLKVLRFLQREPFSAIAQLQLQDAVWQELHETMRSLIRYHASRDLASERVMVQLLALESAVDAPQPVVATEPAHIQTDPLNHVRVSTAVPF